MELILNTVIRPIFKYSGSYFYKFNKDFVEISDMELIDFLIDIFEIENIMEDTALAKVISNKFNISISDSSEVIYELIDSGFLSKKISKDRYSTNTLFFSLFDNLHKEDYQEKLKNSEICVLGLGGSTLIIQQLAQIGVGKITGLDFDILEESNLNRQVMFLESDVGTLKNETLYKRLKDINSSVEYDFRNIYVKSSLEVKDIISNADIVILALDEPIIDSAIWIHDECKKQGKKLISGGVWGDSITYTLFDYSDKNTPCYKCLFEEDLSKSEILKEYSLKIKGNSYSDFNTTTIFVGSVLAGIVTTEIVKLITNYSTPLNNCEMLSINTSTWEISRDYLKIDTSCEKCRKCHYE